jgi:FkbM family methyltransferase
MLALAPTLPSHHPLLAALTPFEGWVPQKFLPDCIGCLFDRDFAREHHHPDLFTAHNGEVRGDAVFVRTQLPPFNEEYFEWVDLLESIEAADGKYVMAELGAGFGRWGIRALKAAQAKGLDAEIILVEADPGHMEDLKRFVQDNRKQGDKVMAVQAAVGPHSGTQLFHVMPEDRHNPSNDLRDAYGQFLIPREANIPFTVSQENYYGAKVLENAAINKRAIEVTSVPPSFVLQNHARVDLLDMDVQGQELLIVLSALDELNKKVKRLHISTHAPQIEERLRETLTIQGWQCIRDFGCKRENDTPYGRMPFVDGRQTWINPRL